MGMHVTINWWNDRLDGIWQELLKILAFLKRHRRFWTPPAGSLGRLALPTCIRKGLTRRLWLWSTECRCRWRSWCCAGISMSQARQWAASIFLKKCSWPIPVDGTTQVMWGLGQHPSDAASNKTHHFLPANLSRDSVRIESEIGITCLPAGRGGQNSQPLHYCVHYFNFSHPWVQRGKKLWSALHHSGKLPTELQSTFCHTQGPLFQMPLPGSSHHILSSPVLAIYEVMCLSAMWNSTPPRITTDLWKDLVLVLRFPSPSVPVAASQSSYSYLQCIPEGVGRQHQMKSGEGNACGYISTVPEVAHYGSCKA